VGDPVGDDGGLSGPGTGDDKKGAITVCDGGLLSGVQSFLNHRPSVG
jgi:hypothetical protein